MKQLNSFNRILVIGSGPIQIGQGCEFDYSGSQACKTLKKLGYKVILINTNPATIMTDEETSSVIYMEPLTINSIEEIIIKEKIEAILPTVGGQVALNLFLELHKKGILQKFSIQTLGASIMSIEIAEDRNKFKHFVSSLGYNVPNGFFISNKNDALSKISQIEFPVVIRTSFTLGGSGGKYCVTPKDFEDYILSSIFENQYQEILVEESLVGWKEFELEVMRDRHGTFLVICCIENIHPMGIHTGDSITVTPPMTLPDREYQILRNISKHIFEASGMSVGGANIQFAIHPENGKIIVIEMNPRVSRSSALSSKVTGYPIASIAAQLAVGYSLHEINSNIAEQVSAAFEPSIDYIAIKIPRWDFNKFSDADSKLGIQMKSVGEVVALGSNFQEAFQKAWRSLEQGYDGWYPKNENTLDSFIIKSDDIFDSNVFFKLRNALFNKQNLNMISKNLGISYWYIHSLNDLIQFEITLSQNSESEELLLQAKKFGYTDSLISKITKLPLCSVISLLKRYNIKPNYKAVDSCAAEFPSKAKIYYKTYDSISENIISSKKKIILIGAGPNRIGQGIEFDYSCVHAAQLVKKFGYESILINCNPETVSTDFSISDKLYLEPIHEEDVLQIIEVENPDGILLQFGGQSALKLAKKLNEVNFPVLGTQPQSIEICEDRISLNNTLSELNISIPPYYMANNMTDAIYAADKLGFPIVVRPSFVLSGKGMFISYNKEQLIEKFKYLLQNQEDMSFPILIDKFIDHAIEYDLEILGDGENAYIAAIIEQIEETGIHSGDSTCYYPPANISEELLDEIHNISKKIVRKLKIIGIMNLQIAINNEELYLLEINPRASRTLPFASKATSIPLAEYATRLCLGEKLSDLNIQKNNIHPNKFFVKVPVFPFKKLSPELPYLGPEMRSIGEVMGMDKCFDTALAKGYLSAGMNLAKNGKIIFISSKSEIDFCEKIIGIFSNTNYEFITLNKHEDSSNIINKTIEFDKNLDAVNELIKNQNISLLFLLLSKEDFYQKENWLTIQHAMDKNIPYAVTKRSIHFLAKAVSFYSSNKFEISSLF
jgi:carbamoyl-phosphate synthase large subunit